MKADDDPGQTRSIPRFEVRTNGVAPLTRAGIEGGRCGGGGERSEFGESERGTIEMCENRWKRKFCFSVCLSTLSLSLVSFFEIFLS